MHIIQAEDLKKLTLFHFQNGFYIDILTIVRLCIIHNPMN